MSFYKKQCLPGVCDVRILVVKLVAEEAAMVVDLAKIELAGKGAGGGETGAVA